MGVTFTCSIFCLYCTAVLPESPLLVLFKMDKKALSEVREECEGMHRELEGLRKRVEEEGDGKMVGSLRAQVLLIVMDIVWKNLIPINEMSNFRYIKI